MSLTFARKLWKFCVIWYSNRECISSLISDKFTSWGVFCRTIYKHNGKPWNCNFVVCKFCLENHPPLPKSAFMRITAVHSHSKRFTLSIMLLITVILQIHSGNKLANVPNYYHKQRNPPGMHFLDANGVSTHIPWIRPSTRRPTTKSLEHICTSVNSWNFCNTISHVGFYSSDPLIYCRTRIPAHGIGPMIWSLCMYSSTHLIRMNIATVPCLCVCVCRPAANDSSIPWRISGFNARRALAMHKHSTCTRSPSAPRTNRQPARTRAYLTEPKTCYTSPPRFGQRLDLNLIRERVCFDFLFGLTLTSGNCVGTIKVRLQFSRLIYLYTLHVLFKWGITTHLTYIPF